jgi:hypothetical protein
MQCSVQPLQCIIWWYFRASDTPVHDARGVQEVQPAGDVQRDAASPGVPGEGALLVGCQRLPQVAALRSHSSRMCHTVRLYG